MHLDKEELVMQVVFRGRNTELKILEKKYSQDGFIMTVIYGRRRIGKTRLIQVQLKRDNLSVVPFFVRFTDIRFVSVTPFQN